MHALRLFVESLRASYHEFRSATAEEIMWVKGAPLAPEKRAELMAELERDPSPNNRYRLEFLHDLYRSFKPGIDRAHNHWFDPSDTFTQPGLVVVEVGAGPGYLLERGGIGIAVDIAYHPAIKEKGGIFVPGDFCSKRTLTNCQYILAGNNHPRFMVLSYCLDRLPDQVRGIQHFAALIRNAPAKSIGLITVCLPAVPASPGSSAVSYGGGEWITRGLDPVEDYRLIVEACEREGLKFTTGGLTTHYGNSLVDGYEELPCYVMEFRPA